MLGNTLIAAALPVLLGIAPPAPAGRTPKADAAADQPQVRIDMHIVQVNSAITSMTVSGSADLTIHQLDPGPEADRDSNRDADKSLHGPSQIEAAIIDLTLNGKRSGLFPGATLLMNEARFRLGSREFKVADGRIVERVAGEERPLTGDEDIGTISAPSLICLVGQRAEIKMGAPVSYMVRDENGCLRVETSEDLVEGLSIEVLVDQADASRISIKELRVKMKTVVDRAEIPGVPFNVGRPEVRTVETSSSMSFAPERTVLITLPILSEQHPLVLVLIKATPITPGEKP